MNKVIMVIALINYCQLVYGQLSKIEHLYLQGEYQPCIAQCTKTKFPKNHPQYTAIKQYHCMALLKMHNKTHESKTFEEALQMAKRESLSTPALDSLMANGLRIASKEAHTHNDSVAAKKYLSLAAEKYRDTSELYFQYYTSPQELRRREREKIREAVCQYAKQFLNIPYKWAGEDSSGFDCSGLVQRCYNKFGFHMLHGSKDQSELGKEVSRAEIKKGDLVFYGKRYDTGRCKIDHVSIVYEVTPDKLVVIHSTSKGVNIQEITSTDYWGKKILFYKNVID